MTTAEARSAQLKSVAFFTLIGGAFLAYGAFERFLLHQDVSARAETLVYPAHLDVPLVIGVWVFALIGVELWSRWRGKKPSGWGRIAYIGLLVSPLVLFPVMPRITDLSLTATLAETGYLRCPVAEAADDSRFPRRHWAISCTGTGG